MVYIHTVRWCTVHTTSNWDNSSLKSFNSFSALLLNNYKIKFRSFNTNVIHSSKCLLLHTAILTTNKKKPPIFPVQELVVAFDANIDYENGSLLMQDDGSETTMLTDSIKSARSQSNNKVIRQVQSVSQTCSLYTFCFFTYLLIYLLTRRGVSTGLWEMWPLSYVFRSSRPWH